MSKFVSSVLVPAGKVLLSAAGIGVTAGVTVGAYKATAGGLDRAARAIDRRLEARAADKYISESTRKAR
jgi:hypothetical protein